MRPIRARLIWPTWVESISVKSPIRIGPSLVISRNVVSMNTKIAQNNIGPTIEPDTFATPPSTSAVKT